MKQTVTLILLFIAYMAHAQQPKGSVSGRVLNNKDQKPVDYASVAVKSLKDSSVVGALSTVADGRFIFKDLAPGNYRLYVAFLGMKSVSHDFTISEDNLNRVLTDIVMQENGTDLQTVDIKGEAPPIVIKTDTLEFNAASFKTVENAVVEDLLKKLPGVEVDKNGSVKAQGEAVTKIKVDGKDFFGNDPLLATKNLPADMIDKIQIIDELSDQAKFTGIDDGSRTKIINITTRKNKKRGYFGNSNMGYGSDDRYDANINVNKFDNEQKISVVGQFNNVNRQNFSGGLGRNPTGRNTGLTAVNSGGLNFSDTYEDNMEVSGNYFFNKTSQFNQTNSITQNLLATGINTTNNGLQGNSDRLNHRFDFMIDTKIDSLTSIRVQPNISYTRNVTNNQNVYTRQYVSSQTEGSQHINNNGTTTSVNNNILIRRKFQRRGRTLSLNLNSSTNDNGSDNYNNILDYVTTASGTSKRVTDQYNDQNGTSLNQTTRLIYTEPLSKTLSLELNYQNGYNFNTSDRHAYNFNAASGQYDIINNRYTNIYENTVLTNSAGFSISKTEKNYYWNLGLAVQNTDRTNKNISKDTTLKQNAFNYTPSAMFRYNFSRNKRLVINYRGSTQQPSINQLQPIPDNTNAQRIPVGNPDLKAEFNNVLRFAFNNYNIATNRSFFAHINFTQTYNKIASSISEITSGQYQGKLAILPVNVNGVYSGSGTFTLGLPLMAQNKLNLNINLSGSYGRDVNFTDRYKNITNSWSVNNGYKLVSNFDNIDLSFGLSATFNRATYSAQPLANTRFYTFSPNVNISYILPGSVRLGMDADYNKNTGQGAGYDTEYTILNTFISKQLLKNRGTFKAALNDVLNQNQGISRTADNNTIRDVRFNVLKRYYMFSLTYALNRMGGRNMNMMTPGRGQRAGFGGGNGGGGGRFRN